MKLEGIPFQAIDWSRIQPTSHHGAPASHTTGGTYVVADGDGAHRSSSPGGARLFIVD